MRLVEENEVRRGAWKRCVEEVDEINWKGGLKIRWIEVEKMKLERGMVQRRCVYCRFLMMGMVMGTMVFDLR